MTAAELVACATRLYQRAAFADNAIYYQNDQKAYEHARAAFHEAGRLLDFCEGSRVWCECGDQVTSPRWPDGDPVLCWVCTAEHKRRIAEAEAPKTCGTCRWWKGEMTGYAYCRNDRSACCSAKSEWPADHGCPHHERKDGAQ